MKCRMKTTFENQGKYPKNRRNITIEEMKKKKKKKKNTKGC